MRISLGRAAQDATPTLTECDWPAFARWVQAHERIQSTLTPTGYVERKPFPSKSPQGQEIASDKNGPYVVLADCGGNSRRLENLVASYGVPLDFDTGAVTLATINTVLQHYAFVAYTTYAHAYEPGAERWRVLVPTATPMDAASHYATWDTLNAAFGGLADPAAKDPVRLSYLPGKCLVPSFAAVSIHDGAFLQPTPGTTQAPVLQPLESGPVPGWAGPSDDEQLIAVACATRTRPDERFGEPIHFAMLWTANDEWLARKFPPNASEGGQLYSRTQADMALAGELAYWTGSDLERMHRLMLASGLRRDDADWQERKALRACERARDNAKQWAFMQTAAQAEAQARRDALVTQLAVTIPPDDIAQHAQMWTSDAGAPPPPSAMDALLANAGVPAPGTMPGLNDYWAYLPTAQFIHRPTGMLHVASSVDGTIGKDARAALIVSRPVHAMTWAPGHPERLQFKDIDPTRERAAESWLYNRYMPPKEPKREGDVSLWLDTLRRLYPHDADHILDYLADAVQHANVKCNHALVLGSGVHGIGKDTLLAAVRYAVGESNFYAIKPADLVDNTNGWVATRILQVSESHDLGDGHRGVSRYEMYERCKDLCAAPPSTLLCNDKYIAKHRVLNVLRLILTTNHRVDGIYLPPEDRRHYCAWSDAPKMTEAEAGALWAWYDAGGYDFVHYFLAHRDISKFNRAKAPPQTEWWHELVAGGRPAEDERFNDAVAKLGRPEWLTTAMVAGAGGLELAGWMAAPGNRRKVEREMDKVGYRRLPNPHEPGRGRWFVGGVQTPVYRRADVAAAGLLKQLGVA